MLSRSRAVPVEELRSALRQRAEEVSLRGVAREVGMSYKGIEKIIAKPGTDPQPASLRKISDWYIRRSAAVDEEPSPETVRAALATLIHHLPVGSQVEAARRLLSTLEEVTTAAGIAPPGWHGTALSEDEPAKASAPEMKKKRKKKA